MTTRESSRAKKVTPKASNKIQKKASKIYTGYKEGESKLYGKALGEAPKGQAPGKRKASILLKYSSIDQPEISISDDSDWLSIDKIISRKSISKQLPVIYTVDYTYILDLYKTL